MDGLAGNKTHRLSRSGLDLGEIFGRHWIRTYSVQRDFG